MSKPFQSINLARREQTALCNLSCKLARLERNASNCKNTLSHGGRDNANYVICQNCRDHRSDIKSSHHCHQGAFIQSFYKVQAEVTRILKEKPANLPRTMLLILMTYFIRNCNLWDVNLMPLISAGGSWLLPMHKQGPLAKIVKALVTR